jgi:hypothetical protein
MADIELKSNMKPVHTNAVKQKDAKDRDKDIETGKEIEG